MQWASPNLFKRQAQTNELNQAQTDDLNQAQTTNKTKSEKQKRWFKWDKPGF